MLSTAAVASKGVRQLNSLLIWQVDRGLAVNFAIGGHSAVRPVEAEILSTVNEL